MKLILKILQFLFKFLAAIFSKIGANHTYTKLYKYLMRYKIISILYNPLKILLYNLIFIIKVIGIILSIFSLFHVSLLHFNSDLIEEINYYINEIIKWIKNLFSKLFEIEQEEIYDPKEIFINSKKEIKVIEKVVESPQKAWVVIPFIILGAAALTYFNPNINEVIDPIINKIEDKIPVNYTAFISGMFVYKFIAISFSKITGFKLTGDDDSEAPDSPNSTISTYFKEDKYCLKPLIDSMRINEAKNVSWGSERVLTNEDFEMETPKATTSQLPSGDKDLKPFSYPPKPGKNPFSKGKERFQDNFDSNKINISDESLKEINPGF